MNKQKSIFLAIAILVFMSVLYISLYVNDEFIRPYFGDFLVVILVYAAVKSIFQVAPTVMALFTLLLSFFVETTQYFHLIELLGLRDNFLAVIILGKSFSFIDLLMYSWGVASVYFIDDKLISKID
ncbi:MAG: hypothetical protein ACJA0Q_001279 [Saprospiraceae bacterium]|jgi:hypothetical protein